MRKFLVSVLCLCKKYPQEQCRNNAVILQPTSETASLPFSIFGILSSTSL